VSHNLVSRHTGIHGRQRILPFIPYLVQIRVTNSAEQYFKLHVLICRLPPPDGSGSQRRRVAGSGIGLSVVHGVTFRCWGLWLRDCHRRRGQAKYDWPTGSVYGYSVHDTIPERLNADSSSVDEPINGEESWCQPWLRAISGSTLCFDSHTGPGGT